MFACMGDNKLIQIWELLAHIRVFGGDWVLTGLTSGGLVCLLSGGEDGREEPLASS